MIETQREAFLKEGFTEAQIEEIDKGMNSNIPFELYANKSLMSQQMYQIRLGLENGVDMAPYVDPEYNWFQLEEIRLGLEEKLDVSKYDFKDLNSRKMHQMRRGLEEGMDLSDFLKFEDDVMKEIRHALMDKIDIINFAESGYDAGQLVHIRTAIKEGLDIQQYLTVEFRGVTVSEIVQGLRDNVDVEVYAKPCYTWAQMEQIRLGLLSQIDVSYYTSPLYDRYQMKEIRLGLEEGLEVDEYTSLMYPAADMRRIRKELSELGRTKDASENSEGETIQDENADKITVTISNDKMTAYIRVARHAFGQITRKDILRTLRYAKITQNIDPRMVDNLLAGKHLGETVQIAIGKYPVDGENGWYEYFFDTSRKRMPKILDDGSVDFQNIDWYSEVKKDQKLAYYHSAGKGEPGHTVTGDRIAPKRGKELPALRGKGFYTSQDKKTYFASTDGRVEVVGNKLEVSQIVLLQDVNMSTGNIRFDGNINITGNVSNGVTIEAGGDVIIGGFVENCNIIAGGDVIIKKGANLNGTGCIVAGGTIEAKFFETAKVRAGVSIKAGYVLNSDLYCDGTIDVLGKKGLILGGTVFAAKEIRVTNLGNELGVRTIVKLGVSDEMRKTKRDIDNKLLDLENKLIVLNKGQRDFQDKYPAEIRNAMEMYIQIENALYTLGLEKNELLEAQTKIMQKIANTADASVMINGTLYDNILFDIDDKKVLSTRSKNVMVKKVNERAVIIGN